MDNNLTSALIFFFCIAMSSFFSSSETAYTSANRIRLQHEAEAGDGQAQKAIKLQGNFDRLLSTILIGNNIVNIASSAIATVFFVKLFPRYGATISTVVTTIVLLLCSEITPKLLAKLAPERVAKVTAGPLRLIMVLLTPAVWLSEQWQILVRRLIPVTADTTISEPELLSLVEEAHQGGSLESEEHRLVRAAINFDDTDVRSILTPRIDVVGIDLHDSDQEIEQTYLDQPYSRLVVYDDTIDHVVGILHERDFNHYYRTKLQYPDLSMTLASILSETLFIPPTMPLSTLLSMMQQQKIHLAVVVDEHGGTMGIVTLEDLLEELVGEIWDEADAAHTDIHVLEEGQHYQVHGRYEIHTLEQHLGFQMDNSELFNTVNGFVAYQLGALPEVGDQFDYEGWHFEVLNTDHHRVEWLDAVRLEDQ